MSYEYLIRPLQINFLFPVHPPHPQPGSRCGPIIQLLITSVNGSLRPLRFYMLSTMIYDLCCSKTFFELGDDRMSLPHSLKYLAVKVQISCYLEPCRL